MNDMPDISARQMNLMIRMVNDGDSREEAQKHFSKEEMKIYDSMVAELAEMREKDPRAAFWPVESDW